MFILKKIIAPFIAPPGFIVVILLMAGVWAWRRKLKKCALINSAIALLLWAVSISPVSNSLMSGLEAGYTIPAKVEGDVIILLGGGIHEGVPDLTGTGTPSEDMLARTVTAIRLYRKLKIPIIISGGSAYSGRAPEAPVIKRFISDLGVKGTHVILETQSRDTKENALFCKEIMRQRGFQHPVLVTSAYHMRRSIQAFKKAGITITPLPAQFVATGAPPPMWVDFLPNSVPLKQTSTALKEYFGLLFYRLTQ